MAALLPNSSAASADRRKERGGGEGLRGAADLAEQSRRRSTGAVDLAEERRRRSESGGSTPERWGAGQGGADLARSGGDGEAEETRRRPGGREWRGLGLPAIRATGGGRRAADLRVERWGGGRGLGVERIWRGAREAERRSAEPRRRRGGGARWAGKGGGLGLPAPVPSPLYVAGRLGLAGYMGFVLTGRPTCRVGPTANRAGLGRPTCLRRGPGTAQCPCRAGPGPFTFVPGRAVYRAQFSCFGPAHRPRA
ncbi:hypothetical protein PVAP13_2NG040458 [Panicum virgatum]|uniref:Uncharacterized protein n=1 Tax=Panicum virgatum TaxID=38727 RepID=A0A8T0VDS0_PANVG|nr:hypothetical protein PVAP13_2NG040458 [Panicum virgatum]